MPKIRADYILIANVRLVKLVLKMCLTTDFSHTLCILRIPYLSASLCNRSTKLIVFLSQSVLYLRIV